LAPIILTAVLGILAFSVMNPIVAATRQREAHILEALGNPIGARLSLSGKDIWLRQASSNGQMVVEADRSAPDGTALFGVRMFLFDTNGKIESRLEAPVAKLLKGEWLLQDARRWIISDNPTPLPEKFPELRVETNLSSDQLLNSFARPETIPFWDLRGFIQRMEDSGFSGVRHRMFLQTELAKPVVYVAMVLIGCAFSMRPTRFGNTASMILGAILAGFAFYFVLDVAASFGAAKQVPIGVAAWAPPIAAIMLAFTLLLHFEDG
jgi:lipopolysaccharide export system permease protein